MTKQEIAKPFRERVSAIATSLLKSQCNEKELAAAAGRMSVAFAACAAAARDPSYLHSCTPESIARCVAIAAQTNIMPGNGAGALAYLVPRAVRRGEPPHLNFQLSHRGLNALAMRAGFMMVCLPIGRDDELIVEPTGEVTILERDIDNPPDDWDSLRGVMLLVKSTKTGASLLSSFVPLKVIEKRRDQSDAYKHSKSSPWHQWPVEMAMKAAMHYAVGRGWCVMDDSEATRLLAADVEGDRLVERQPTPAIEQTGATLAGVVAAAAASEPVTVDAEAADDGEA